MDIEDRKLTEIFPYDNNPRLNAEAVDAVAASIREFGWQQPLVVDEASVIIVGHTRFKAAQKLSLETVPVHVARNLTPAQARAYRIADNQTATIATWDDGKLVQELLALQSEGFDLDLTGFSAEDLDRLMAPPPNAGNGDADDVPEPPAEPVTHVGDIWLLGRHRLVCGDSTNPNAVARLLDGHLVDLLLTDPPYNVCYEGKTSDRLVISNDAMDDAAFRRFLAAAFTASAAHLAPGAGFYLWHADTHGLTVRNACHDAGLAIRQCLVWVKQVMVLGRQDYHWRHEPCLYGWKDGAAHTWLGGRTQTTVLEYDKPARNGEHPTMKPVELFAALIANSCPPGGVVLDPFGGSGTTLIACEQTGRTACLVELDPRYCDVIVKRYESFTGGKAERAEAGHAVSGRVGPAAARLRADVRPRIPARER